MLVLHLCLIRRCYSHLRALKYNFVSLFPVCHSLSLVFIGPYSNSSNRWFAFIRVSPFVWLAWQHIDICIFISLFRNDLKFSSFPIAFLQLVMRLCRRSQPVHSCSLKVTSSAKNRMALNVTISTCDFALISRSLIKTCDRALLFTTSFSQMNWSGVYRLCWCGLNYIWIM